jgi:AcrR family transcriptional regulator
MEKLRTDRRITRTRRHLRDAFLALILERGYDAVTIEDITEKADLGRTTFYLHYKDKEDLLLQNLTETAEDLKAQVKHIGELGLSDNPLEQDLPPGRAILLAFQHAAENADLYRVILKGEGATRGSSLIRVIIEDSVMGFFKDWLAKFPDAGQPRIPLKVAASYFSTSLLGFITWWLENDMPYPPEKMKEMFIDLFFMGARQAMGVPIRFPTP